ncbi:MAG: LamG-like jellyroll fold domain-containing protein, partial [Elusimicrobiota bacterium]
GFNTTLGKGYLFQAASSASPGGTYDAELSWYRSTGRLSFVVSTTGGTRQYVQAAKSYADGDWHFVSAVLNTTGMYLYVDGNLAGSGTGVNSTTAQLYATAVYAWVGAANTLATNTGGSAASRFYPGLMDEVLISSVALSAPQAAAQYALTLQSHGLGAPQVDVSTQSGAAATWVRLSTNSFALTGTKGTTSAQTWTSTMSLQAPVLVQTASPGADTDQVMFLASSLDSNETTVQFRVLVDTTPPAAPSFSALAAAATCGLTVEGLSGSDALSGLNAAPFRVQASTDADFGVVNADSGWVPGPDFTFASLNPNTTYYVRARVRDAAGTQGNASAYGSSQELATLAVTPSTRTPAFLQVALTSATLAWYALPPAPSSRSAQGYVLEASTAADFTGAIFSSATASVAQSTLTAAGLDPNTTYYFRAGSINQAGLNNYISLAAASTRAQAPVAMIPQMLQVHAGSMTARWAARPVEPSSAACEGYRLEASSTNFGAKSPGGIVYSSATADVLVSTLAIPGLHANTTYYLRVAALNWNEVPSYTVLSATSSLSHPPAGPNFKAVDISSVSVAWGTFPASPSSMTAEGYLLEACSDADFFGDILSSKTAGAALSTLTVSGLFSNTTYYFRVAALNWNGAGNYVLAGSTLTRPSIDVTPPTEVTDLAASTASASAAWLRWSAPADLGNDPWSGTYAIQHSTYAGEVQYSTTDAQVNFSTANVAADSAQSRLVSGLMPNTTHFFRLWAADSRPNWSPLSNGATVATLANAPAGVHFVSVSTGGASLGWWALPAAPSSATAEGYLLEASSTNFGALSPGGQVYSSATARVRASTLTIAGLQPNTTYFYRAASLNWLGRPNYAAVIATSTLADPAAALMPVFLAVNESSAVVRWAALPSGPASATCEGYRLEASSTDFGALAPGGLVYSSATVQVRASTLTVSGLDLNTAYYYRVGSLNWNGTPDYVALSATSTLARAPVSVASTFTAAANNYLTAQWSAEDNPDWTQYRLQLSTAPDFTGDISQSEGPGLSGSVYELLPNTTYYGRAAAVNNDGLATVFTALGSTATLASQPAAADPAFAPVYVASLTVSFDAGSPANPADTVYEVQLSSYADFSVVYASSTKNQYARYIGLTPNTTYYAQVRARNRSGLWTSYTDMSSTATWVVAPGPAGSAFSAITADGFILEWTSGTAAAGYNPDGTTYAAEISTASDFTGTVLESIASSTQTAFSGLASGTLYYARVRAMNYQGIYSAFTSYGSATTLNSAKPAFIPESFLVADSLGQYLSPDLYTDTTTPKLRIQVQSNYTPGLSVADTPSHLALWHLDEGAGASGLDASRHSRSLALGGAPAPGWTEGKLGSALDFDGTQNYAVSANLTPWRASAADSQFTVSLWFNTTLGKGYLFQAASSASPGGTYDAELSWYRSTGRLSFVVSTTGGTRQYVQAAKSYADGDWHFVSAVLNTTGMYLYVDGNLAGSGTGVNSTTAQLYATAVYAWVGAANTLATNTGGSAASRFYPGLMDEVLISSVALSAPQAAAQYALTLQSHGLGAPQVDVSTQSGAAATWVRLSTNSFALTGTKGTTSAQTWTSTMSLQAPVLVQTASPGADTDQVMFLASSLDSNETTVQFRVLVDTTPPAAPSFSALAAAATCGLTVEGLSGSDALSGLNAAPFRVQASTDADFGVVNADSGWVPGPDFTFASLNPNTTYYVRARVRDAAGTQGNASAYGSSQELATLAVTPSTRTPAFLQVALTSATLAWYALPPAPSSRSAQGYVLEASTAADFTGAIFSSATAVMAQSTLTVSGLDANTTYYFRTGSLNPSGSSNFISLASTSTLADIPSALSPALLYVHASSISARWAALPAAPASAASEGYRLEASSTNFGAQSLGGIVYSSSTADVLVSTLSLTGLDANTTYYLRVAALNWNGSASYRVLAATSSLTRAPAGPNFKGAYISSVSVAWGTFPASPSSMTAEAYMLQACSDADFSGDILSSKTWNAALSTLTVSGLFSDTTYYFRVAALNWNGVGNYVLAGSTLTRPSIDGTPPSAVADLAASTASATAAWLRWSAPSDLGNDPWSGTYAIQHSTYAGEVQYSTPDAQVSFSTANVSAGSAQSRLVSGLMPNTTHFFRLWAADSRPNWSPLSNGATVATLANAPAGVHFVSVSTGGASLGWGTLPAAPSSAPAEGYLLEASSTNFGALSPGGQVYSSATANVRASTLAIAGLQPNTTYYYRVASLNWLGTPNYAASAATSTLAAAPIRLASDFLAVYAASATVRWAALPIAPSSATCEGYRLEASSTDFGALMPGGLVYSSATASVRASTLTVSGLDPDTRYYYRAASLNWSGALNYATFSATSTLARVPASMASTFTAAGSTYLAAQWSAEGNPAWTEYVLQLSTASDFKGEISESADAGSAASVYALLPNTTYYGRVAAVNLDGVATAFVALGSTATLASQPAAADPAFAPVYVASLTVSFDA